MTSYMFRLTDIKTDETRSNYWDGLGITGHDTDTATLAVQVGDQLFPPVSKFLGDLSKGHTYPVDLAVGPVEVNPGDLKPHRVRRPAGLWQHQRQGSCGESGVDSCTVAGIRARIPECT